jgi:hypothetical protein
MFDDGPSGMAGFVLLIELTAPVKFSPLGGGGRFGHASPSRDTFFIMGAIAFLGLLPG